MSSRNPTRLTTLPEGKASYNPTGRRRTDRLAARSLTFALRDAVSDEELASTLLALMRGEDPYPKLGPDGQPIQGLGTGPDWAVRMAALKMLLERRNGMPMQEVHVKAEIEAFVATAAVPVLDYIDLDLLAPGALDALEDGLAGRLEAPAIDVKAVEK